MKTLKLLLLVIFAITVSCKDEKTKTVEKDKAKTAVKHYVCKNKCEDSGGDVAGICPVCNTPYTHNQAYHDKDFLKSGPLDVPKSNEGTNNTSTNNANASPAQNAKGVYHYTCKNGCYGGSGTATTCNVCGESLVHNTAYHN